MSSGTKLTAYAASLALVLGAGAAVGAAAGPDDTGEPTPAHGGGHDGAATDAHDYRFEPAVTSYAAPGTHEVAFRIVGPGGETVDDYEIEHDKEMHLIAVSQRLDRYAHVHPERDAEGVWRVDVPFPAAGPYRLYADFTPGGGTGITLAVDVAVAGPYEPGPLDAPDSHADAGDGFRVEMRGTVAAHSESDVELHVTKDGEPVRLAPYLGASGHLVAIRGEDLAYLHVHPVTDDARRGEVQFAVEAGAPGRYRLFFDFEVGGTVRTAAFTVDVTESGDGAATDSHEE